MKANMQKLIRVGIVSSVNTGNGTVRVIFEDEDNKVSDELAVQQSLCGQDGKTYKMPIPGEQVVCTFLASGSSNGFVSGSIPSKDVPPAFNDINIMGIKFGPITISLNKRSGDIDINTTGNIKINGNTIKLNCD